MEHYETQGVWCVCGGGGRLTQSRSAFKRDEIMHNSYINRDVLELTSLKALW